MSIKIWESLPSCVKQNSVGGFANKWELGKGEAGVQNVMILVLILFITLFRRLGIDGF